MHAPAKLPALMKCGKPLPIFIHIPPKNPTIVDRRATNHSMHIAKKRWKAILISLAVILALLIAVIVTLLRPATPAEADAVSIALVAYTNISSTDRAFALITISNRADYAVRWRGDWIEVEGNSARQGRIVNTQLPGHTYSPVLGPGDSFILSIGEPNFDTPASRWRFVTKFQKYGPRERWDDLATQGKIPVPILRLFPTKQQQILNQTNHATATSDWLRNATSNSLSNR
jgi:hypothetical protein